ncbi:hypothetical protein BDV41DRAFT_575876 [Aspergillus transmontanensis]|uniref:SMP-30/Gluconolactonase/LRE-like region domain-containing protein n=1 Tax=Aspergillus transmontanensis TaxID=1034304 RepID=A0A5N6W0F6_9EURO|nr:hypothetical protein BDV41DRAFT_575876 [Aspergillus transmontanensis]
MADVQSNLPTIKRGKPLDSFLEGPIYISTLDLLFVADIPYGRIFFIYPNANWTLVTDRELQITASRYQGKRLKGHKDLVITADGVIYFTDQGMAGLQDPTGRVFRLYPDGRLQVMISNGSSPNGLVLSRGEKALFVAMTRDNAVWYVPLLSDGSMQRIGRFSGNYGIGGPDGMAQDAEGNVLVAHSTLGTVFVHTAIRELVMKTKSPRGVHTTNLTWGGPSMNVLYIVESETATILKVDWHCDGSWMVDEPRKGVKLLDG